MSRFLQHIRVGRYGGLADCEVGPFSPGLNVVYGPNEAGKSTVASLVGGVLFGWEDAHGVRNTYRPDEGGRAGELVWAGASGIAASTCLRRDEDGVTGDASALGDIDKPTFDAIFSLTADELRTLRSSSDVMARLLTAGSGTASSPSAAFVELERRIASTPIYQLETQLEDMQEQVKAATAQVQLYVQEDRELRELEASRAATAERVSALDDELESLIMQRAELEAADARYAKLVEERDTLAADLQELSEKGSTLDERLLALDSSADRVLRDRLDELAESQAKVRHAVETAKENSSSSTAAYEALCEIDDEEATAARTLGSRTYPAVVSVLLPLLFTAAGIPLFMHGRQINSLSFTALGVGLLVVAVFLAFAAFYVLFRRPKTNDAIDDRRKDAQWVMLQDRKKLDACLAEQAALDQEIAAFMEQAGLSTAGGSIRQARSLLDEAREQRAARAEDAQRASSLRLRLRSVANEVESIDDMRSHIAAEMEDVPPGSDVLHALSQLVRKKTEQREALLEAGENMSQRFGELTRELEFARTDHTLDQLKFSYQQIRVRLREAKHELIALLLAKRMLERSIAMWESQSQPEVNALAGRLLSTMTGGRWASVATSATGSLVALDSNGAECDPRHLSLGTCQQLYLALRIALLIVADDVGRAIPVLADDILVNFDASRRRGAAHALAELAARRQVIVFTCHEETAAVLQEAAPSCTRINL